MKNNLIKIIKKSLLLATVLFISCSKDNYEDLGKENNSSKYKLTVLNSKELKQQGKLVKKLDDFRAFTKLQNDNNKTATSSIYNFSIDTKKVNFIEAGNIKTYTFKVNRTIDNGLFENLLISQLSDGSYTVKLLQYNLSESEKTALFSGSDIDVNGKLNVINIDDPNLITDVIGKFQGDCFDTIFVYQEPHNCHGPDAHAPGNIDCPFWFTDESMAASYGGYVSFIVSVDCDGGGGGDGLGVITTPEGGGGNPNFTDEDAFFAGLTPEQSDWINDNEVAYASVLNYLKTKGYSTTNETFVKELIDIVRQDVGADNNAFNFMIQAQSQNKINNNLDENFLVSVDQFVDSSTIDPILTQQLITHFSIQCAVLRYNHPTWSNTKIYWEASKDLVHIGLDVFGLIPVIGEPADLINGALYTIEGDGVNATLSFAGAIPLAGWVATGTKLGLKIVTTSAGKTKLIWKIVGTVIQFGDRGQLRKVLGLLPGNPLQAHHLIPWSSQSKMAVQKAAKYSSAFHMNEALNGIAVAAWRNQPNHTTYNNLIDSKLDNFRDLNPNATPQECYIFVTDLINDIRTWVINHPGSHLNDLVLP